MAKMEKTSVEELEDALYAAENKISAARIALSEMRERAANNVEIAAVLQRIVDALGLPMHVRSGAPLEQAEAIEDFVRERRTA